MRSRCLPACGDVADGRQLRVAVHAFGFAEERRGVAHRPGDARRWRRCAAASGAVCLSSGSRPRVGLSPTRPLQAAGIRIEPPPSLACAIGTTPAATNAPAPDDDAPAVWSGFHGLRTGPSRGCSADALKPNSDIWVLPSGDSPVARKTRAKSPSARAGRGSHASVPCIVGMPATATLSLMNVGTPSK